MPPASSVSVKLSEVRLEQGRRFGDGWLGWKLWRVLKLDEWMEAHLEAGREEVGWAAVSTILVLARLYTLNRSIMRSSADFERDRPGRMFGGHQSLDDAYSVDLSNHGLYKWTAF